MTARLRQHAVAGVDQDDGEIGGGRAGGHVARVLLVAGGIGDDEFAARRGELAICHVDGDALLALGREAVGEQRQIGLSTLGNVGQLVQQHRAAVDQQAANQRAFAVIDAAAGDEFECRRGIWLT